MRASLASRRLNCRPNNHITTARSGYCTLDQKELTRLIDTHDLKILRCALDITKMPSHALTRKNTSRILRHANRTWRIV
jgi:RNase P protein component